MPRSKLIAIGVSAVVLGLQVCVTVLSVGDWYWPFMTYAMYSVPRFRTDSVPDYRLVARDCDPATTKSASLGSDDVRVPVYQLREVLGHTAVLSRTVPLDTAALAAGTRYIDALVTHAPGHWCEVEIWERKYANTGDVAAAMRSPWRLALRWPLGEGSDGRGWTVGDRIAPSVPPLSSLPSLSVSTTSIKGRRP